MVGHLTTSTMDVRGKNLEKKYFYLGEYPAVVRLSLYDDVTTRQFLAKISYFEVHLVYKLLELALQIVFNMW